MDFLQSDSVRLDAALADGVATPVPEMPLEKLCRALFATMVRTALGQGAVERVQVFLATDIQMGGSV